MEAKKKLSTRMMAINAILIAVMIVMMVTPLGRLPLPLVSVTIAHIPILVTVIVFGLYSGLIVAFAFGITSLLLALAAPSSLLDPFFVNPLISVLPRMLIPVTTFLTYRGLSALLKKWPKSDAVSAAVSIVVGNLTNTFGVYTMLYLIYAKSIFETTGESAMSLIITAVSTSTFIKCVVVVIITTPLVLVLKRVEKGKV